MHDVSTPRAPQTAGTPDRFPVVPRGYDRSAVEQYAVSVQAEIAGLRRELDRLNQESLAGAERVRRQAADDAERILARAQRQAAAIDERARQEFAWRRRRTRREQDRLTRFKQALLGQLTFLSALAGQTAERLQEVPDPDWTDLDADTVPDPAQNNRSSALSSPRSRS